MGRQSADESVLDLRYMRGKEDDKEEDEEDVKKEEEMVTSMRGN